ncbi:hypothetical protein [Ferruginibacter sp. HRS2-29]|uniref:hypothetical protein n=1 Tax=Ferruginibacter sp. HRS2-29 TaxID=2487334 RepID=UPI0020CC6E38|nr:hypothetical protein [Ferruginibacter sp. HRS2-29]MCP9751694.1 hypothetical protein [Ferruginibacter sp. HRS2-29]
MAKFSRIIFISSLLIIAATGSFAQVNAVTFGKNRLQFKKFKWQYYQTKNFNVYFYEGGQELAKYVAQAAEKELPEIEAATEYSLQRRANIILYNNYTDRKQTNIGLETDIIAAGNVTRLVNNKMVVFYDANHANLKRQVRQGIADIITKNLLFGDDIGEVAGNQTLLDLPVWLTDGYVAYVGENWNTDLDDELKSEMLSGNYSKFSKFSFEKPLLAGHAFWYFIEEKYKKENVTYFLYLARTYKNLNKASVQITKKKFNELLQEFMEYNEEKYYKDITRRKGYPKGNYIEGFDISKRLNYYRFNVNPNKKDNSYVVTQFKKGIVRVILNIDYENKTLLKYGIRTYENSMNPNYPLMAWDPKGTRISVIYSEEGKLKLFVYDIITRIKTKIDLTEQFDQVQDVKYMLNSGTLLLSAVKNGHADIFTLNLQNEKVQQITNDVYDNLDASFVAFPNKTGIIFSSNRPSANAKSSDTVLPSNNRYNVFLITDFGDKPELNQISQLTNLKYGNARFPMQYNQNHFTFVSDENGINNRYAGFFTTKKAGLDTLVLIGEEILRNPSPKDVDSTLRVYKKTDVDSVAVVSVSEDSAYSFPLTNYPSGLAETRIAGDNNQVSEVTRQSDEKVLYKLKIDEMTLNRRNVTAQPTEYAKKLMRESRLTSTQPGPITPNKPVNNTPEPVKKQDDFFQNEFSNEKKDTSQANTTAKSNDPTTNEENFSNLTPYQEESVLKSAKLYRYKPLKFSADFGGASLTNNILINRYQVYGGGSGPIQLTSSSPLNGLFKLGTSDLMEDIKINGAFKIGTNLKDNEWLMNYQNLKRRFDWGLTYYRNVQNTDIGLTDASGNLLASYPGKIFTNLYQANVSYPFDEAKSLRLSGGLRSENIQVLITDNISPFIDIRRRLYSVSHLEFVYDNSLNTATNIWNGLRYKVYADWNVQVGKKETMAGRNTYNVGLDARYYYPIYRNFIWAGRAAADFSFGNQKIIYYLGGTDGWLMFGNNQKSNGGYRYFNEANKPANDQEYAFQGLAVNMRGYIQNLASGNNAVVINSEFRLPVWSTFFDKTVNNAFVRDFQIVQFIDLGTAWNGGYEGIKRPSNTYVDQNGSVSVKVKAGGVGPFAGGYGFGARSTLLGYFVKFDAGWPMDGFFKGKPVYYFSLGLDF